MKIDFNAVRDLYRPNQQAVSKGNGKYFRQGSLLVLAVKRLQTRSNSLRPLAQTNILLECFQSAKLVWQ